MKDLSLLIVGGGNGLGALIARMAAEEGARAIGLIDVDGPAAETALNPVRENGIPSVAVAADIATRQASHRAFQDVTEAIGDVYTLVTCAAIYPRKPILEISDDDWDASNAINIKGTYHMMVAAVHHMRERDKDGPVRGRIVNITSVDAFKAHPQNAHYAATKAAAASLTRSFAHEVAPDGILVNSVAPAGMAADHWSDGFKAQRFITGEVKQDQLSDPGSIWA